MSSSAINLDRMLGSDSPSLSPLSTAEELQREALQASIREKLLPAGGERRHRTALDIAYEYRRQHKPLLVLPGFKGHLGQLKRVRKNGRTIIPDDKRPASFQHWPATEDRREVITSPPSWLGGADGDVMYGPLVITVVQHEGPVNYLDTRPFGVAGDRRLVSDRGWQPGAPLPNLDAGAGSDASEVSPAGTSIETPTMGLSWGVPPAIQSLYRPPCGGSTLPQPPTDPAFVVHLPDGSSFSVADTVVDDAFLDVSADEVIRLAQAFEERVAGCTCAGGAAALGLLEGLPCSVGAGLEEREIGFRVAEMASNAYVYFLTNKLEPKHLAECREVVFRNVAQYLAEMKAAYRLHLHGLDLDIALGWAVGGTHSLLLSYRSVFGRWAKAERRRITAARRESSADLRV